MHTSVMQSALVLQHMLMLAFSWTHVWVVGLHVSIVHIMPSSHWESSKQQFGTDAIPQIPLLHVAIVHASGPLGHVDGVVQVVHPGIWV
jgi:hypothetical protein